jgi:hypothetical protein
LGQIKWLIREDAKGKEGKNGNCTADAEAIKQQQNDSSILPALKQKSKALVTPPSSLLYRHSPFVGCWDRQAVVGK